MSKNKTNLAKLKFTFTLIGKPPIGLLPGDYFCSFNDLKTKSTKTGIKTEIKLNILKEGINET